jgi:acyl-CoA synthetase (AMP-forming)/AMP-acid ligase II
VSVLAVKNVVVVPEGSARLEDLVAAGEQRFSTWAGQRVAFNGAGPRSELEAVVAAATVGFELAPMPDERFTDEWRQRLAPFVHRLAREQSSRVLEEAGLAAKVPVGAGLALFTSGSTGAPKLVRHTFETLNTFDHVRVASHRWLVTYLTGTYAWSQVVALGLFVPDQTLVFPESLRVHDVLRAMSDHGVTAVPSTPTFWRYLLSTVPRDQLARLRVRQVTLGGERADQAILDKLRETFPRATITHVFATTETGPAITVSDGRAGFPAAYLDRPLLGGRVRLQIREGTLWVLSPYSHLGGERWIDTGDIADVEGDRVHIRGRGGYETINVAGHKVAKAELEDYVQGLRGIVWARAYSVRSTLAGSLVGMDAVVDPDVWATPESAEVAIVQACQAAFSEYHVPRRIRILDELPLFATLKTEA